LLEDTYKEKMVFSFVGGSIPVIGFFRDILKSQVISIPLANEDCNMHGVNENLRLDFVNKSLDFSRRLFSKRE
jgi:acetylornithine deacetylase/succinyl-diaminopimelate desuccinylase-like protein